MTLADGLDYYKQYSDSDWEFTFKIEIAAAKVVESIPLHRNQPSASLCSEWTNTSGGRGVRRSMSCANSLLARRRIFAATSVLRGL
jgi:hypothetical protein